MTASQQNLVARLQKCVAFSASPSQTSNSKLSPRAADVDRRSRHLKSDRYFHYLYAHSAVNARAALKRREIATNARQVSDGAAL